MPHCIRKMPSGRARYVLPGSNPGLVVDGNINLFTRPNVPVPGHPGEFASVLSISYDDPAGRGERLVPSVIFTRQKWRIVGWREAAKYSDRTGEHLGIFSTVAYANRYSNRLHLQQAALCGQ